MANATDKNNLKELLSKNLLKNVNDNFDKIDNSINANNGVQDASSKILTSIDANTKTMIKLQKEQVEYFKKTSKGNIISKPLEKVKPVKTGIDINLMKPIKSLTSNIINIGKIQEKTEKYISKKIDDTKKAMIKPIVDAKNTMVKPFKDLKSNILTNLNKIKFTNRDKSNSIDDKKKRQDEILNSTRSLAIPDKHIPLLQSINQDTRDILKILQENKKGSGLGVLGLLGGLAGLITGAIGSIAPAIIGGLSTLIPTLLKNLIPNIMRTLLPLAIANVASDNPETANAIKAGVGAAVNATKLATHLANKKIPNIQTSTDDTDAANNKKNQGKLASMGGANKTYANVGGALGFGAAYGRFKDGDYLGAILQGTSAGLTLGSKALGSKGGIAATGALAIDTSLAARDLKNSNLFGNKKEQEQQEEANNNVNNVNEKPQNKGEISPIENNNSSISILSSIDNTLKKIASIFSFGNKNTPNNKGDLQPIEQNQNEVNAGGTGIGSVLGLGAVATTAVAIATRRKITQANAQKNTVHAVTDNKGNVKGTIADDKVKPTTANNTPKPTTNIKPNVGGGALSAAKKFGGKLIPGVGLVLGAKDAYDRAKDGDYLGAAISGVGAGLSIVPGLGFATSLALGGVNAVRDNYKETGSLMPDLASGAMLGGGAALAATAITKGKIKPTSSINKVDDLKAATDASKKVVGDTSKNLDTAVKNSSKSITDATIDSNKNITNSVKTATANMGNTSKLINTATNTMKTGVNKMFSGVNGELMKTIGKLGAFGVLGVGAGAAIGAMTLGNSSNLPKPTGTGNHPSGNNADYVKNLGSISSHFESGGRGVKTISGGVGDKGGVSYGKHQLSSKTGTMKEFLNSKEGSKFKSHFGNSAIGSKEFNDKYTDLARVYGRELEQAQHDFITRTHYGVQSEKIKQRTGLDVNKRGRAVQELAYSTSVQYRNYTGDIFEKALGKDASKLSDADIINKVMDYKAKTVGSYFKSSSAAVQRGVSNRIVDEKKMLLEMNSNKSSGAISSSSSSSASSSNTQKTSGASGSGGSSGTISSPKDSDGNKSKESKEKNSNSDSGKNASDFEYDLDKICATAVKRALPASNKQCAEYVRIALQAGDNKKQIKGGMGHARDWNKSLPSINWYKVGENLKQFKKGDIAFFGKSGTQWGHVCIYTGTQWVSDFVQNQLQPNGRSNYNYDIYRAKSGFSNGSSVNASGGTDLDVGAEGEGYNGGGEGKEYDLTSVDGILDATSDILGTGLSKIFESDAMDSVRNFMKGDVYSMKDNTPDAIAQGDFTKNIDQITALNPRLSKTTHGLNGMKDDLNQVLGRDDFVQRLDYDGSWENAIQNQIKNGNGKGISGGLFINNKQIDLKSKSGLLSLGTSFLGNLATNISNDKNATKTGIGGLFNRGIVGLNNILGDVTKVEESNVSPISSIASSIFNNDKQGMLDGGLNLLGSISTGISGDKNATKTGIGGLFNRGIVGLNNMLSNINGNDNDIKFKSGTLAFDESSNREYAASVANAVVEKENYEAKKFENVIQIPPTINVGNSTQGKGGDTDLKGLSDPLIVKNTDSIPHALALAMMRNSI